MLVLAVLVVLVVLVVLAVLAVLAVLGASEWPNCMPSQCMKPGLSKCPNVKDMKPC